MILAVDAGTTGARALVLDEGGRVAGSAYAELPQRFPRPGWVEQDPREIWEGTLAVCRRALDAAGIRGSALAAIGIASQRETAVAWDRATGEPLHPAIVWQDRRTAARCDELRRAGAEGMVRARTGLLLDPYFSGTKFEWMLREGGVPPDAALGTVDAWLLFKLTGRHATDCSNASRTLLYDIRALAWDPELCESLHVPLACLPEPVPSAAVLGQTRELGGSIPVAALVGDQQAALYGQACHAPGLAKSTNGTGNFLLRSAGTAAPPAAAELISTVAWGIGARVDYAVESPMFVTGAGVQWLRDGLGIIEHAAETEALARSLRSNDGVYFVPALAGLGSPHWDPYARGTIVGLTRGSTRAHVARAALEAIAYQTADAVRAQDAALDVELRELRADGGAAANAWLMQFQADVLGVPVVVPAIVETTALGAGYLAGVATGVWSERDVRALWREGRRYEPRMGEDERRTLLARWRRALERAAGWAQP